MKYFSTLLSFVLALVPFFAFAVTDLFDAEDLVIDILNKLGYFFWLLSLVAFFYGLVKFIANSTDPAEREKGKSIMLWGIIAFVVLFSVWAIVSFILVDTLQINAGNIDYVDKNGSIVP